MPDRILDLSEEPVHLCSRLDNLVLRRSDGAEVAIPFTEIAVVVASHPQITLTQAVLAGLSSAGAVWIACDPTRLPVGMVQPLQSHSLQTERMSLQISIKRPLAKRAWQQVVRAKIACQGAALSTIHGSDSGIASMSRRVRSGDPENVEAQAARKYWPLLFDDPDFRRDPALPGRNQILNYGYAVLRAMTARAICAVGLHPSIGIHHHNRYSTFVLADDLMEPYRPVVDVAVFGIARTWGSDAVPDKNTKIALMEALTSRYPLEGERRTLFEHLTRTATSLWRIMNGESSSLILPDAARIFDAEHTENERSGT